MTSDLKIASGLIVYIDGVLWRAFRPTASGSFPGGEITSHLGIYTKDGFVIVGGKRFVVVEMNGRRVKTVEDQMAVLDDPKQKNKRRAIALIAAEEDVKRQTP